MNSEIEAETGSELAVVGDFNSLGPAEKFSVAKAVAGAVKQFATIEGVGYSSISGKKYPKVETWMAVANCVGWVASSRDVEKVDGGYRAIGEVRKISDGGLVCTAEGFVGEDETTWFGHLDAKTGARKGKRADYAIRAMAQTRAISRACRSALAFIIPLMNAGLETVPAEEVPMGGFDDAKPTVAERFEAAKNALRTIDGSLAPPAPQAPSPSPQRNASAGGLVAGFGSGKGKTAAELDDKSLAWYSEAARRSLADPSKERFHARETAWLNALEAEMEHRAKAAV